MSWYKPWTWFKAKEEIAPVGEDIDLQQRILAEKLAKANTCAQAGEATVVPESPTYHRDRTRPGKGGVQPTTSLESQAPPISSAKLEDLDLSEITLGASAGKGS